MFSEEGRRRRSRSSKGHQVSAIRKERMERSLQRKSREGSRHRSLTPRPLSKGVPNGPNETTTEKQQEALEAPKNQQEETPRPMAVPRGDGEETEAKTPRGKSLHRQGSPGSKSSQEQGIQRKKNIGSRVALLPGKFLPSGKFFKEKNFCY